MTYRMPHVETLTSGQQSQAYELGDYTLPTLQVVVEDNTVDLAFYGTIDGVNWAALSDVSGAATKATLAIGKYIFAFPPVSLRAVSCAVTGGSGTAHVKYQFGVS